MKRHGKRLGIKVRMPPYNFRAQMVTANELSNTVLELVFDGEHLIYEMADMTYCGEHFQSWS